MHWYGYSGPTPHLGRRQQVIIFNHRQQGHSSSGNEEISVVQVWVRTIHDIQ